MNCSDVRQRLPELTYGDLDPHESAAMHDHLRECPDCRKERLSLERLRQTLDALPAPAVSVDLQRVLWTATQRQARRLRHWRRTALALGGMAALLALVFFVRLEVRVDANQVSLRWGSQPEQPAARPTPPADGGQLPPPQPAAADVQERLELLTRLIHALADDAKARDGERQREIDGMQQRLDLLQAQDNVRWTDTKRDLDALYVARFGLSQKGTQP